MAKFKIIPSKFKGKSGKLPKGVILKWVRDSDGQILVVRTLNANSKTFGTDLRYVFEKNVKEARKENRQVASAKHTGAAKR